MITKKYNKRRNYFIKKKFQAAFILKFCLLMGLGLALSGVCLYLASRATVTTSFLNSRLSITSTSDYLLPVLVWAGLAAFFASGIIATFVFMYLSHRIAGAMFNMERSLSEIANGDLTRYIKLRSSDQLQDMATSINSIAKALKDRITDIKDGSRKLGKDIESLLDSGKDNPALMQIVNDKERLDKLIDYFKVK